MSDNILRVYVSQSKSVVVSDSNSSLASSDSHVGISCRDTIHLSIGIATLVVMSVAKLTLFERKINVTVL